MNLDELVELLNEAADALAGNLTLRQPLIDELRGYACWLRDDVISIRCIYDEEET